MEKILDLDLQDLKDGFQFDKKQRCYVCLHCGKSYHEDEIFQTGNRYTTAHGMIRIHMNSHGGSLEPLLSLDKKYVGLTDVQKELLSLFAGNLSDKDIAQKTGTALSTVRHQRFVFREKAKQAKVYLAIYENVFERQGPSHTDFLEAHGGATMLDDRYFTTSEEEQSVLENMFLSLSPLRLKVFPAREKKKIIVLRKIAEQFEKGKRYKEQEVNEILKAIHDDFATVRRYLIEYGFLDRTKNCSEYWRS